MSKLDEQIAKAGPTIHTASCFSGWFWIIRIENGVITEFRRKDSVPLPPKDKLKELLLGTFKRFYSEVELVVMFDAWAEVTR